MSDRTLTRPVYRIYRIDVDGQFLDAELLEALDDLDALVRARDKIDGSPIELWDRDRLIARLDPDSQTYSLGRLWRFLSRSVKRRKSRRLAGLSLSDRP